MRSAVLLGAVAFVMLITCANVASLMLSDVSARHREAAIRAAIGATRRRLFREVVVESVLLAAGGGATVVAACLRNAAAVSAWLNARATTTVTVIACGERWHDGSLRPALEDHLGAGAVIAGLDGDRSPEAQAAAAVWRDVEGRVGEALRACSSGREQQQRGWADDLRYAEAVNASSRVPVLRDGAFVDGR